MRPRAGGAGDTMCHARRCRDAGKRLDRSCAFPLQRSKTGFRARSGRIWRVRQSAITDHHINRGFLGGNVASAQREQTRRPPTDPPTENDVRNAIERVTVSATRIEIVLSESIVGEGQDRLLTLPWTRTSSRRRREIIQGVDEPKLPQRAMRTKARDGFVKASASRSSLARRTPVRPQPEHRVARRPRGQERALDPDDAVPRFSLPRPGGSRNGRSASARVLRQAPDRAADALVRPMGRPRTAGADSGAGRTRLIVAIHPLQTLLALDLPM